MEALFSLAAHLVESLISDGLLSEERRNRAEQVALSALLTRPLPSPLSEAYAAARVAALEADGHDTIPSGNT